MSIKIAEAHRKCRSCNNTRAQRYCPRLGKDICWKCCNDKRIDRQCPLECAYIIQDNNDVSLESMHKRVKVDSLKELTDLTRRFFNIWCESPAVAFGDQIPVEMTQTEEGRKTVEKYLSSIKQFLILPEGYIEKRLNLQPNFLNQQVDGSDSSSSVLAVNYESLAEKYLDRIITHDWTGSIELMFDQDKYKDLFYRENYINRRESNRLLRKLSSYQLLLSAVSENREEAMVYFEIDQKYDLTLIMGCKKERWLVKEIIIGSPSFFYGEREAIVLISGYISQQEMNKAKEYLEKYREILIDSPDLHYLNGLYCLLTRDYQTSQLYYLTAVELDPEFYEYKYNLALVYQMLQKYELAKKLYQDLLSKKADDVNVLNNLSVIYEAEGKVDDALQLLAKCLEIDPNSELAKKNIARLKSK